MNSTKSGSRTLLTSVLMSAPGPLVMGLGLTAGRSATQLADFVRRTSELLAIAAAYAVYRFTTRKGVCDDARRMQLERLSNGFVGAMMILGGTLMLLLTLLSEGGGQGNVIPALVIAVLGVIANTIFWRRYTHLNRATPNAILAVQARLYRAKSLVDGCVTAALAAVVIAPGSPAALWLDRIGSAVVAAYLIHCGVTTVREAVRRR